VQRAPRSENWGLATRTSRLDPSHPTRSRRPHAKSRARNTARSSDGCSRCVAADSVYAESGRHGEAGTVSGSETYESLRHPVCHCQHACTGFNLTPSLRVGLSISGLSAWMICSRNTWLGLSAGATNRTRSNCSAIGRWHVRSAGAGPQANRKPRPSWRRIRHCVARGQPYGGKQRGRRTAKQRRLESTLRAPHRPREGQPN